MDVIHLRWEIARLESKKTCIFKPAAADSQDARDNMKKAMLGAVYGGSLQKLPRGNKRATLVWEAREVHSPQHVIYECFFVQRHRNQSRGA